MIAYITYVSLINAHCKLKFQIDFLFVNVNMCHNWPPGRTLDMPAVTSPMLNQIKCSMTIADSDHDPKQHWRS